ncbi:MAG TPA: chromosome segregation protein SMC [Casimicrobiaceae bacterium]
MRLTQIKLSGFKSFVDPTVIATPGQLVGIVGPNGCGKSNVIDAVRWVLGESKASVLRGESMQDVIFSGAGERKPVGRASVELAFDNSEGRIGGQWGQYAELSIKRVLTRDGDSTYYINGIPVRRRDIHDLFLGTGLGPRAYAIIEQGMISRVIEARPEDLRIFLEEAAGVSRYKERRRETESRLADTRENLARVEDIRRELGDQITHLEEQARVATQYRELGARHRSAQHLHWFARMQDGERARSRVTADIATETVALEGLQAELRRAQTLHVGLRDRHLAAGDALRDRQEAWYAANSEVSRLEQQLAFSRENATRLAAQVAQIDEGIAALAAQGEALAAEETAAVQELDAAHVAREEAEHAERAAHDALPAFERALAEHETALDAQQRGLALIEQEIRVAESRRDHLAQTLAKLAERRDRLSADLGATPAPDDEAVREIERQLDDERREAATREAQHQALHLRAQELQTRHREAVEAWQQHAGTQSDFEARAGALAALQMRIGHASGVDAWLAERALGDAARLWQRIDVETGWEDALEAVLRERLNALRLTRLDDALRLAAGERAPARVAVYANDAEDRSSASARATVPSSGDALASKIDTGDPIAASFLADCLHGVRCRESFAAAMSARHELAPGEAFVTPEGHWISRLGIAFFAPDSELHGVIARRRELTALAGEIEAARARTTAARAALDAAEAALGAAQDQWHAEGLALASQQRRCHDLELELVQLRQHAEAAAKRRLELEGEAGELATQHAQGTDEHATIAREIADLQSRLHDEHARREPLRATRNEAEIALVRAREALRDTERAAQEAAFAERRCGDRQVEIARRRDALTAQIAQQQSLLAQATSERATIDWTPVEEALQRQLTVQAAAEQALAAARNEHEGLGAELVRADEARLAAEQQLEPARTRIQELQLKEQAAALAMQQFRDQLDEAHADLDVLGTALAARGSPRTLPGEIEKLAAELAALGAVNLAALDELARATERKGYLDRQAADLTEAMSTLESAIRQIDRESRELLQQTFDRVNENFGKLFPTLFGGGRAKLLLTGDEILDSGVQVIAQPPGKRNATIHVLSGGEKAMTATALIFALFQINPAPFCLLDEVDAPLDESNTHRFCSMVRDMAGETQFVFISHNKVTMEMASQLVGITMQEPGVSRVVAVDIAEALELADTELAAQAS